MYGRGFIRESGNVKFWIKKGGTIDRRKAKQYYPGVNRR